MDVCFTGTRKGMTGYQMQQAAELLQQAEPNRVCHGCAIGADRQFHHLAPVGIRDLFPCNAEQLAWARQNVTSGDVIHPVEAPLDRNRRMVDRSVLIIAAPQTLVEEQRSGTWSTVRYARRALRERWHIRISILHPHHLRTRLEVSNAERAVTPSASEAP